MYFITIDSEKGSLARVEMVPTQIKLFRVNRASEPDALWIKNTLNRGAKLGTRVEIEENALILIWR